MIANNVEITKSIISKISREVLGKRKDPIVGLREIYGLLSYGELTENENYNTISAIVDETETVVKEDIRDNFSQGYLEEQDKFEKEYLEENKFIISRILKKLSGFPIIDNNFTEPEDPYAWPFEEYR